MAQTAEGAMKTKALRSGCSLSEYMERFNSGLRWCTVHKQWHSKDEFGSDINRPEGLAAHCRRGRREIFYHHTPIPADRRKPHGPARAAARDEDKQQARKHVNLSTRMGKIPKPSDLPCFDCGHHGSDQRHEYDHYLGYRAEFHMSVQAVCSKCHHIREMVRGTHGSLQKKNRGRVGAAKAGHRFDYVYNDENGKSEEAIMRACVARLRPDGKVVVWVPPTETRWLESIKTPSGARHGNLEEWQGGKIEWVAVWPDRLTPVAGAANEPHCERCGSPDAAIGKNAGCRRCAPENFEVPLW